MHQVQCLNKKNLSWLKRIEIDFLSVMMCHYQVRSAQVNDQLLNRLGLWRRLSHWYFGHWYCVFYDRFNMCTFCGWLKHTHHDLDRPFSFVTVYNGLNWYNPTLFASCYRIPAWSQCSLSKKVDTNTFKCAAHCCPMLPKQRASLILMGFWRLVSTPTKTQWPP